MIQDGGDFAVAGPSGYVNEPDDSIGARDYEEV
jgi:hypothetical protein